MSRATPKLQYPLHALLLIGLAWLFYAAVLLILTLTMLPIIPLAPFLVLIMVSLGGLLGRVHEYGRSVATTPRATRLKSSLDGKDRRTAQVPAEEA